ncbi:hypothetical protein ANCDUO_11657 [Ancylostoma duodenale]|uniref:Uncharacterized protein n=1 Tax=Ancylostoma duodenale TaxID=51022 RepID=A0A0C2D7N5_9BILA|nr:hypothetical protein ANCDUO_11657 [Ancylostoma duodenale]
MGYCVAIFYPYNNYLKLVFFRFSAEDPIYEKAIAECYVIKESPSFCEGILLKCIDKQPCAAVLLADEEADAATHVKFKLS